MLKKILLVSTFLVSTNASAMGEVCTKTFNLEQLELMQASYDAGKTHDYGWTLAAMAWQESSAGEKPLNWSDPSFGPFHANIKTVSKRYGAETQYEEFYLASELMFNFEFAVEAAVAELDYWKKIHKGDWNKMWGGYNAGWNKSAGEVHAQRIINKISFLKRNKCIDVNNQVGVPYVQEDVDYIAPDSLELPIL
jgi:hypothetical protein